MPRSRRTRTKVNGKGGNELHHILSFGRKCASDFEKRLEKYIQLDDFGLWL